MLGGVGGGSIGLHKISLRLNRTSTNGADRGPRIGSLRHMAGNRGIYLPGSIRFPVYAYCAFLGFPVCGLNQIPCIPAALGARRQDLGTIRLWL